MRKPLEILLNSRFRKCMFLTVQVAFAPKIAQGITEENTATRTHRFAVVVFPSFMTSVFS